VDTVSARRWGDSVWVNTRGKCLQTTQVPIINAAALPSHHLVPEAGSACS
jgi:hypothetical protein